ncbi:MAG: PH domain-containing protein [Chloroflexi bacterium]|nr:PH domain-containing protein [Chloroflexota bacterium]MBP8054944.1 PH domain-containing protein [Chloroflexota bacterium]
MNSQEVHARVKARIWQALAQNNLSLAELPKEKLEALVSLTAEAALLELDGYLEQKIEPTLAAAKAKSAPSADKDGDEEVLWEGRPFLSLSTHYTITSERLRIVEGVFGKEREDIELIRIQDIDVRQAFRERLLNLGDILIAGHDSSHPKTILNNISDPETVHELLRRAILKARKKHGLVYREVM